MNNILNIPTNTWRTMMLTGCQRVTRFGLYGFLIFVSSSIAFAQICLTLLALSTILEISLTRRWPDMRVPLNRPLLIYLGVVIGTSLFAVNVGKSIKGLDSVVLYGILPLYYARLTDVAELKRWLRLLLAGMIVAALYGVVQHYYEVDLFRLPYPISFLKHVNDDLAAPVRISGFFSIYMTFAGQLAMVFPLAVSLFFAVRAWYHKILLAMIVMLLSVAVFWTYTRSAWIAIGAALVVGGMVRWPRRFGLVLIALIIALGLGLLMFPYLIADYPHIFRDKDEERLYTWITTLDVIRDYPFTGIGKGSYGKLVDAYRERRYPDFEFSSRAHAHNNPLQTTVESGIFAGICFLWLWGTLLYAAYRSYHCRARAARLLHWLALGLGGALVAFFVQGIFDYNWGDSESAMLLFLLMAITLKLPHLSADAS